MSIEPIDPYERLDAFRRQTNAILDELLAGIRGTTIDDRSIAFQPDVDLVETENEFRFYLSIPGMIEDDVLIDVDGRHVTVRGERKPPYDSQHRKTAMQEWRYGFFERQFELPVRIAVSSIRATYDSGVLTIVAGKVGAQGGPSDAEVPGDPHSGGIEDGNRS